MHGERWAFFAPNEALSLLRSLESSFAPKEAAEPLIEVANASLANAS
jgi:hypothetical protein